MRKINSLSTLLERVFRPVGFWDKIPRQWSAAWGCCLVLLLAGCATRAIPVADFEGQTVVGAFEDLQEAHQDCGSSLDAAVEVKIARLGLFGNRTGVFTGYLQAKAPAFLKFVGLNPLGQPQLLTATDGKGFQTIVVHESKGFEGTVASATYKKYAPPGFSPESGFYWLTGRLPSGSFRVISVSRAAEVEHGYWLALQNGRAGLIDSVLFDPQSKVIRRHLLKDGNGHVFLEVHYAFPGQPDRQEAGEACVLPDSITISSLPYRSSMELTLTEISDSVRFTAADFELVLPESFERIEVE